MKTILRLAFLLVALCAGAASVAADRSPFSQGHWWNPARAGSGFEFFNVDDRAMVIWYTYEESGRPVWYTAQGSVATMGAQQWPLLRHRWVGGVKGPVSTVGSLSVTLRGFEAATVIWTLNGIQGSLPIEPFRPSTAASPALDRTGSWFAPANSGWGFSLTEQGDVFGGVLFTYDAAGEPAWAAGFGRDRGAADLFTFEGACPSCSYRASSSRAAGRVTFDFNGDTQALIHNGLTMAMAPGVNIDGATLAQLGRPASTRPADRVVEAPVSGGKFSFLEPGAVSAPNGEAQVTIQRTGGTSGAFDIHYTYEGQGCARTGNGGPVRFGEGDATPKTVSIPMRDAGVCMVWVVPPPAPAALGPQSPIGITVVPIVPGCPRPTFASAAELPAAGNPLRHMQRSGQTVFIPLPAPADGRASGQITFGETAATPQPVTLDISINRCPGIIESDTANFCNVHTTNGNYNAIVYLARAVAGIDRSTAARNGYCWAGDGGTYYINARWTYASCPSGLTECGFAIQQNHGPH